MSGKISPHIPKGIPGQASSTRTNSAEHPAGKQKPDSEPGSSGAAREKDSPKSKPYTPGQEAPPSLSASVEKPIPREEGAVSNRPDSGSNVFDDVLSLMGGGRFKNWDEYHNHQTLMKGDGLDRALDKNAFVSAHLDPDCPSPAHEKNHWTKKPGIDHPMHADYLMVKHPEYYSFRRPTQHSGPLTLPSQAGAKEDHQVDPRSTQSTPAGSPRGDRKIDSDLFPPRANLEGSDGPGVSHPPKEGVLGTLSTPKKVMLGAVAALVAGGVITAAVLGQQGGSSNASGEAQA